jgi:hypothetical protein
LKTFYLESTYKEILLIEDKKKKARKIKQKYTLKGTNGLTSLTVMDTNVHVFLWNFLYFENIQIVEMGKIFA